MERQQFIEKCNERLKLIRAECSFSQEKMAGVLGLSKKTIVEIEKGRTTLGWAGSVALCTIFANSEVLSAAFGGNPKDAILALAFNGDEPVRPKTMGGKVWWKNLEEHSGYKLQQNIISKHYRVLDENGGRVCSSFEIEKIKEKWEAIEE